MKLTLEQYKILWIDAQEYYIEQLGENSGLRFGQTFFNYLELKYPDLANSIRGTDVDPFYNDNKIHAFIDAIVEEE